MTRSGSVQLGTCSVSGLGYCALEHGRTLPVALKVCFRRVTAVAYTHVRFMTTRYCFLRMKEENPNYIMSGKEGKSFCIV